MYFSKLVVMSALAIALVTGSVFAEAPRNINYQGLLSDTSGASVGDGIYSMRFQIYDSETDGNVIWTSFGYVPIQVTDGLFSHILGSTNPIPDSLTDYDSLWLGITVAPDEEFTPRALITSAAFALRSSIATTALTSEVAVRADTASYANVAESVLKSRDLYHQILDVNPYSTTTIPFIMHDNATSVKLYVYGSGYQGGLAAHTHGGNNSHTHEISGTIGEQSVPHTHSFSGNTSNGGSAHTHSGTTSSYNLSHSHSGTTNSYNLYHRHSGTTDNDGAHHHDFLFQGALSGLYLVHNSEYNSLTAHGTYDEVATGSVGPNQSYHHHDFSTGYWGGNHSHPFSTNSWGGNHNHTLTTGNASSSHNHSFSGTAGSHNILHSHSFEGSALSSGDGLEESGTAYGTLPSAVYVYVDGSAAAGPFDDEFSSGELDLASFVSGPGEHYIEIKEEGGNGGRITYNLFVE